MMLDEHVLGRAYVRDLRNSARLLECGADDAVQKTVSAARGYAALLRDHIEIDSRGCAEGAG